MSAHRSLRLRPAAPASEPSRSAVRPARSMRLCHGRIAARVQLARGTFNRSVPEDGTVETTTVDVHHDPPTRTGR
ncbi:MAG: hypothetical protein ACRDMX_12350 [Solirubrobacteraceae bacterium]